MTDEQAADIVRRLSALETTIKEIEYRTRPTCSLCWMKAEPKSSLCRACGEQQMRSALRDMGVTVGP